jgi:hypothetical protein
LKPDVAGSSEVEMVAMSAEDHIPAAIEARIRNRIIEYLELAASFEAQVAYQARAPVHVPHEVINQCRDWVPEDPAERFSASPAFSYDELAAVTAYDALWNEVAAETPDPLPALSELQSSAAWRRLRDGARRALAVFAARGRLPE